MIHVKTHGEMRRGFTLIELLAWLVVAAAVAVLVAEIIQMSLGVMHDIPARDTTINRVDDALDQLRRDVWSAGGISIPETGLGWRVELVTPAGVVVWETEPNGEVRRTRPGEADRAWRVPPYHFSTPSRAVLQVSVMTPQRQPEKVWLVSQRLMGGAP